MLSKGMRLSRRQFGVGVAAGVAAASQGTANQVIAQRSPGRVTAAPTPGKRPNVIVMMADDIGWGDPNAYGFDRGIRTPNLNRLAEEGVRFTSWYGQSSCTAGRASFITGRIPVRSALSVVVAPGDSNHLRPSVPTIAQFFKRNGYQTYMSGKWHLGDKPEAFAINHGFDEMKHFLAYYAGVYAYTDTRLHPTFPRDNPEFMKMYSVGRKRRRVGGQSRPAPEARCRALRLRRSRDDRQQAGRERSAIHPTARQG